MLEVILSAVFLGLLLSLYIGPIFFLMIHVTIEDGIGLGFKVLLGAFLGDLLCIGLCWEISSFVKDFVQQYNSTMSWIAAIFFIGFGIFYIRNNQKLKEHKVPKRGLVFKSFLINVLNPSVIAFWLLSITFAVGKYEHINTVAFYILIAVTVTLILDSMKMLFVYKLKGYLQGKLFSNFRWIVGFLLIGYGTFLAVSS